MLPVAETADFGTPELADTSSKGLSRVRSDSFVSHCRDSAGLTSLVSAWRLVASAFSAALLDTSRKTLGNHNYFGDRLARLGLGRAHRLYRSP